MRKYIHYQNGVLVKLKNSRIFIKETIVEEKDALEISFIRFLPKEAKLKHDFCKETRFGNIFCTRIILSKESAMALTALLYYNFDSEEKHFSSKPYM